MLRCTSCPCPLVPLHRRNARQAQGHRRRRRSSGSRRCPHPLVCAAPLRRDAFGVGAGNFLPVRPLQGLPLQCQLARTGLDVEIPRHAIQAGGEGRAQRGVRRGGLYGCSGRSQQAPAQEEGQGGGWCEQQ